MKTFRLQNCFSSFSFFKNPEYSIRMNIGKGGGLQGWAPLINSYMRPWFYINIADLLSVLSLTSTRSFLQVRISFTISRFPHIPAKHKTKTILIFFLILIYKFKMLTVKLIIYVWFYLILKLNFAYPRTEFLICSWFNWCIEYLKMFMDTISVSLSKV